MSGNDNDGGGVVSQADLAGFRQDTTNEMAQFQAVVQKSIDDFVEAARRPVALEGANGTSGLEPQSGGSAAGGHLPSQGFSGASLPGQPIAGGFGGAGALGQPVGTIGRLLAGAPPPTSGAASYPVTGTRDAYAGQPGAPYLGQASGIRVGPGGGYGYGSGIGGASPLLGPAGGIAAGPGGGVGYRGALAGAGATGAFVGQPGGLASSTMGGVGHGSAWGGAGAVGASHGQMGTLTLGSGAGLDYGGALGGAGATAALSGQAGGPAVGPGGGVVYRGAMGGAGVPSLPYHHGHPGRFAVDGQGSRLAVGLGGRIGHGRVGGGAGAIGALYGHPGGPAVAPGMKFGLDGARGGAGAIGALPGALGQVAHDGLGPPGLSQAPPRDGSVSDPSTALEQQIIKIVTARAVASWGNDKTRLWQVICGGRPASMQRTAVEGYMGDTVDVSARVHQMLESLQEIYFLAFVPRGGAGVTLPLSQHLCILGHALVTVVCCGFPQDEADLQVARARVGALRVAFESGAKMLNAHVMEHYAIANTRVNRTRLAELVRKDLVTFTLDLHAVANAFGHDWPYPPKLSIFPNIPGPYRPRLVAYINSGGLINADVLQPATAAHAPAVAGVGAGECRQWAKTGSCRFTKCVFTHVGPARVGGNGNKRKAATATGGGSGGGSGGRSGDGVTVASGDDLADATAKKAKGKGKAGAACSGGGRG